MRLAGKTAIVTGAATGIGRAIALALAAEGASVAVDYVQTDDTASKVVQDILATGGKAVALNADVSDASQVADLVTRTVEAFGRLDIMVNNAGIEHKMPFLETPLDVWSKVIAVNLTGAWICAQEAALQMVRQGRGGRIINISSVHEDLPMPSNAPYCAAKGGLRMLMRTMALELAPHGITVNNIGPGAIDTPMDAPLRQDPESMRALLDEIPLGRMGKPEDVSAVACFLASDDAGYVTGSTYFVDGGLMRSAKSL
ncbi:MAG TPA: SDR family oxidoreductase [Armatimonadota bacterium]|jgi:glucose 1-dehydrogenase